MSKLGRKKTTCQPTLKAFIAKKEDQRAYRANNPEIIDIFEDEDDFDPFDPSAVTPKKKEVVVAPPPPSSPIVSTSSKASSSQKNKQDSHSESFLGISSRAIEDKDDTYDFYSGLLKDKKRELSLIHI